MCWTDESPVCGLRLLGGSPRRPPAAWRCCAGAARACRRPAGSSPFSESRWPSNTVVSQLRWFSTSMAQIFAAAPASLSGPATSRSCMPSPPVPSLITMIGRNAASGAFDFDFNSPRHSARRPATELAPPTSTPNSVRCSDAWARSSSPLPRRRRRRDATTSGIGAGDEVLAAPARFDQFAGRGIGRGHHRLRRHQRRGRVRLCRLRLDGVDFAVRPASSTLTLPPWPLRLPLSGATSAGRVTFGGILAASAGPWPQRRDDGGRRGRRVAPVRRGEAPVWRGLRSAAPGGGRRNLACDGPGHGLQPLFQPGDAGKQPVAVAVEGIDRGGQPLRLVVAFPGE